MLNLLVLFLVYTNIYSFRNLGSTYAKIPIAKKPMNNEKPSTLDVFSIEFALVDIMKKGENTMINSDVSFSLIIALICVEISYISINRELHKK